MNDFTDMDLNELYREFAEALSDLHGENVSIDQARDLSSSFFEEELPDHPEAG